MPIQRQMSATDFMEVWQRAHSVPAGIPDYDPEKGLTVVAALLVNKHESNPEHGCIKLGGKSSDTIYLLGHDGIASDLPTSIWGDYGRTTWCYCKEDALVEAIASRSRGPIAETSKGEDTTWLYVYMDIPPSKFFALMKDGLITAQQEKHNIHVISIKANIPARLITHVDVEYNWPMGTRTWAHIRMGTWQLNPEAFCTQCATPGPTWMAYCSDCWVKHWNDADEKVQASKGMSYVKPMEQDEDEIMR